MIVKVCLVCRVKTQPIRLLIYILLGMTMVSANNRIYSLDVFRGLTIVLMILVNSPGTHFPYPFLAHASWHGCTFADLVFPSFLFIVGITTVISFKKQQNLPKSSIYLLILKRAIPLFLIGILLNAIPNHLDFASLRYYGVLQRIAVCYTISALIYLNTNFKSQLLLFLILLWAYWLIMTVIPVPGIGANRLTSGGSWASYIDQSLFSSTYLHGKYYDPEGLLSTLTSIATTLMGMLTAHMLLNPARSKHDKVFIMILCAWLLLALGWLWNFTFPINKSLWTSSFVLWTGGYALLAFAFCYLLIDLWGYETWAWPFKVFGMNALFIYVCHVLLLKLQGSWRYQITDILFGNYSSENAALFYALMFIGLNFILAWCLYKRKLFIKL